MTADTDDDSAAATVAADIASFGKSRVLTDVEREQRRLLSEVRDRQRIRWEQECRIAHQREQAEAEQAKAAEWALAAERDRQAVGRDIMERTQSQRQITGIYDRLRRAEEFRNHVVATSQRAAVQQNRQALIADVEKDIAALNPTPAPEPTIVVVQEDDGSADFGSRNFDVAKWAKKSRPWWR